MTVPSNSVDRYYILQDLNADNSIFLEYVQCAIKPSNETTTSKEISSSCAAFPLPSNATNISGNDALCRKTSENDYVEEYIDMWRKWEENNYNPLVDCNLSQFDIINLFGLPSVNNRVILSTA